MPGQSKTRPSPQGVTDALSFCCSPLLPAKRATFCDGARRRPAGGGRRCVVIVPVVVVAAHDGHWPPRVRQPWTSCAVPQGPEAALARATIPRRAWGAGVVLGDGCPPRDRCRLFGRRSLPKRALSRRSHRARRGRDLAATCAARVCPASARPAPPPCLASPPSAPPRYHCVESCRECAAMQRARGLRPGSAVASAPWLLRGTRRSAILRRRTRSWPARCCRLCRAATVR